jgi:hypothetical protein
MLELRSRSSLRRKQLRSRKQALRNRKPVRCKRLRNHTLGLRSHRT